MNFDDVTKIKTGFFHALGYVLSKFSNAPMNELYKSSHNISSDEVWADKVNYSSNFSLAETEAISNDAVTQVGNESTKVIMYPLYNSDRQAWFLDTGMPLFNTNGFIPSEGWVKPLISPVDVTNDAGAPSKGFRLRMFNPSGTEIDPGNGRWEIDYYSGIIKFQLNFTPTDTGNGLGFDFDAIEFLNSPDKVVYLETNGPRAIAFKYSGDYLNITSGDKPLFVEPSFDFSLNNDYLQEIGLTVSIGLSSSFNRGSITPQYTSTSPFRAGTASSYSYNSNNYGSTYSTDYRDLDNYVVQSGLQVWTASVNFDEGVQPKDSNGFDYDSPYPSGIISSSASIYGVYPAYATSNDITVFDKQELSLPNDPIFIELINDTIYNKQSFMIPSYLDDMTGIEQEIFEDFVWLWGNKDDSLEYILSEFSKTTVNVDVNNNEENIEYYKYEYTGVNIGSRIMKIYFK